MVPYHISLALLVPFLNLKLFISHDSMHLFTSHDSSGIKSDIISITSPVGSIICRITIQELSPISLCNVTPTVPKIAMKKKLVWLGLNSPQLFGSSHGTISYVTCFTGPFFEFEIVYITWLNAFVYITWLKYFQHCPPPLGEVLSTIKNDDPEDESH